MATTTINRTTAAITDDDGSGTTGTVANNAWYQLFCDAIDAILSAALTLGGILSLPAQPTCSAYRTTQQSLTDSTLTIATLDAEDYDVGSMHSLVTNTSRVTIPTGGDGKYAVVGQASFDANATGIRQIQIYKNNATVLATCRANPNASQLTFTVAAQVSLVATDYLELRLFQSSGGALNSGDTSRGTANALMVTKMT